VNSEADLIKRDRRFAAVEESRERIGRVPGERAVTSSFEISCWRASDTVDHRDPSYPVARQSLHRPFDLATGPCPVPSKETLRRGLNPHNRPAERSIDQEVEMPEPMINPPTMITRDGTQESNATTYPLPKTTHAHATSCRTSTCRHGRA